MKFKISIVLVVLASLNSFGQDKKVPTVYDILRDIYGDIAALELHDSETRKRLDAIEEKLPKPEPSYLIPSKTQEETAMEERLENIEQKIRDLEMNQQPGQLR